MSERRGGIFIGEETPESGASTLIAALGIFPVKIWFLDEDEDLPKRMPPAAYLVLPALECHGVPRALVEAFASGLPVIASRVGLLAELVEPGRNGFLFEPGSPRELARRLAWAEAFPEKMRQMGECARADYRSRFIADWAWPTLFGERRRLARA
jgi:glycosyltransferase involved in cell wall biosynthesis